jgi:hypothetical protein
VTKQSPTQSWFQDQADFRCLDCGSEIGFRSRRRTFSERFILPLFLLQPVRCGECFRRDYRWTFTRVKDRMSDVSGMVPAIKHPAAKRNIA